MKRHLVSFLVLFAGLSTAAFGGNDDSPTDNSVLSLGSISTSGADAAPIRVFAGQAIVLSVTDSLKRVAVSDPAIADGSVISPHEVLVSALKAGNATVMLWNSAEQSRRITLDVVLNTAELTKALDAAFGAGAVTVRAMRNTVVLTGRLTTKEDTARAASMAQEYSQNPVNLIQYSDRDDEQVLLEVKFAEVDHNALLQLGANLLLANRGNTIATSSTQKYGGVQLDPAKPNTLKISDLLNLSIFRTDLGIGAQIKALQEKKVLQLLAEPNLIALNHREASFLAGGEFPIPVVQGGGTTSSVTILFKEYGVKLKFTPSIQDNGIIRMHVAPEVSALDFSAGVTLSGFTVPGLTMRRADTELELKDGQSFALAGLLDNRLNDAIQKVPGLGNVPVLGLLYKSKDFQKSRTELVVIVTAHLVTKPEGTPALPLFPDSFNDKKPVNGGAGTK